MLRTVAVAGLISVGLMIAPKAEARSLQDIYNDMVIANGQQPCSPNEPATATCKASTRQKIGLAAEVAPLIQPIPAPPRSPASNAMNNVGYISEFSNQWTTSNCDGSPGFAAKYSTCDGSDIQGMFDGLTTNIGKIVHGT